MSLSKVLSVHFYCKIKPNAQGEAGQRVRALCTDQAVAGVVTGVKASRNHG